MNQERERLVMELNNFESDFILSAFNNYLNGALDEQVNNVVSNWSNKDLKEFIEELKKVSEKERKKFFVIETREKKLNEGVIDLGKVTIK